MTSGDTDINRMLPYYKEILSNIPDSIDFNFIPVKSLSVKQLFLTTSCETSIYFKITNAEHYVFQPNEGIITKLKPIIVEVSISPTLARVYVGNAQICLDKRVNKIFKLSCVSKYPYLTINRSHFDLGIIEYGKSSIGEIIIVNSEPVPGNFQIIQTSAQPGKHPQIFKLSTLKGEVPSQSSFLVKINFTPFFPKSTSYETYELRTTGGNVVKFSLSGGCTPLKIFLNAKYINFNTVELGSSVTKLIRIYNDSDLETDYQILHSNGSSVFFIKENEIQGSIKPHTNLRVNVTFKPNQTTLFYERVFCIAKNHSVFPLDLYGSCHDLLHKTLLLNQKYIETFRNRLIIGEFFANKKMIGNKTVSALLPEELKIDDNLKDNKLPRNSGVSGNIKIDACSSMTNLLKTESETSQLQLQKEILWESTSKTRIISFSNENIDFNYVGLGETSSPYVLMVNNNTNKKINIKWVLERPIIISNLIKTVNLFQNNDSIFIIQPEEVIIEPRNSYTFKVYFKPNKHEYYFYNDIPCLATVLDDKFNNFQINQNVDIFNQTSMGFNALNHENEKQTLELNNLPSKNRQMGSTAYNFKSNGIQKNNQLKPLPFKGATNPSQTAYARNNSNKIKNKPEHQSIPAKTTMNFHQKKLKKINLFNDNKKPRLQSPSDLNYFNPPFSTYLSVVGHSFPPGNQLYIPMYDLEPKREIFFPSTSVNQSQFQILKIKNRSDTPLFYAFTPDMNQVFRVARKFGLIPANQFHLILIEFCPRETTTYRYPLRVTLNHDNTNIKTIILNGFCVDPVIEIEGVKDEIYFPPSFIGITTNKKLTVINRSPIKVHVSVIINKEPDATLEVIPSSFDMESNLITTVTASFKPLQQLDFKTKIVFKVERLYDDQKDIFGIYSPRALITNNLNNDLDTIKTMKMFEKDKREYCKEITVIGKGSDGDLKIEPTSLDFGTVKVGFHKKLFFSIFNPTMTNFYIKLEPDTANIRKSGNTEEVSNINDIISFDFKEGLINSFCKKDVSVLFKPINRYHLDEMKVNIYATEHEDNKFNKITIQPGEQSLKARTTSLDDQKIKTPKCQLTITVKGDYPLIKIADVRNNIVGINNLWHLFNVDQANEELQKQLTHEEIYYMGEEKTDKKINDYKDKLKCIKLNFGKHIKKKINSNESYNVYLTLKNIGGVPTEFYFKFPGEVSVFREIWMDPVEPSSNDKFEYHVLKEKIFELEPKKGKLDPGECCNIRLKYNYKEKGNHKLNVIFQVVNGKPLIFQLNAICFSERQGMLEIKRPTVNFSYVPIGSMDYIMCPLELYNVGGVKIRYKIDKKQINDFNKINDDVEIFKIDQLENNIGPGDLKYIPVSFRPLTSKEYVLNLDVYYVDEAFLAGKTEEQELQKEEGIERIGNIPVVIKGIGYHPYKFVPPKIKNPFENMPKTRVCNEFNGEIIQKCGLSVEEIDFGECEDGVPKNQTFIIYNFSKTNSFNFEFGQPGFTLKDEIEIRPNGENLEPGKHKIIKMILTPKGNVCNYDGELDVKITWNNNNSSESKLAKEILHIRLRKTSVQRPSVGKVEKTVNKNQCFIETLLSDLTREILCEEKYQKNLSEIIDEQPLGIFDWTNNVDYPKQAEVRDILEKRYTDEYNRAVSFCEGNINLVQGKKGVASHYSDSRFIGGRNEGEIAANSFGGKTGELFGEAEDYKIQEKYTRELLDKYKLTVAEVNESLALVNEESRKLISNEIMESTIYNIISEAVCGDADLSEKTRIYFFNK